MNLATALSFTGNQYHAMSYKELEEVTRALAEAARKRISRLPSDARGPAYQKLVRYATGEGSTKKINALNLKNGIVRISQNFRGSNKMSMSDLRSLRKVLYDFIKDETSTKRGLEKFREEVNKKTKEYERELAEQNEEYDLGDEWMTMPTDWELFDKCITDTDLIEFGKTHLDWQSDQIYDSIISSGGYENRGKDWFNQLLRDYVEGDLVAKVGERPEEPMKNF